MRWFLVAALAGCAYQPSRGPSLSPTASAPRRLGFIMWTRPDTVVFCNRRIDDDGHPRGVTGPCFKATVEEPTPSKIISFTNPGQPDPAPPEVAPAGCKVEREEAQLVPSPRPARAWVGPPRQLLDEWSPAPEVNGDRFVLETTLSPDGKTLAIARLAIGVGEGERTIELAGLAFRAISPCR